MNALDILESIQRMEFKNTFNPYFDRCPVHDSDEAPELRRWYLSEMLDRASELEVDAIWVGRDLGYRGGRRTGLALTDDVHFSDHLSRWGLEPKQLTCGAPVKERTATVIWEVLQKVSSPIFLWNVFPLHPFEGGKPFSNRAHNAKERDAGVDILMSIIELVKPTQVIAIGNDAFNALSSKVPEEKLHKVRHPSYGGQTDFLLKMKEIYGETINEYTLDLFSES
ncbi:uracil-DNA glycosylase [Litorimonas haliclonae]|uniref:uracil-DNA glycosylase n=1 Tax=Litorimonas haliclonae TaxID=2081977 RepID=UPI0039F12DAC